MAKETIPKGPPTNILVTKGEKLGEKLYQSFKEVGTKGMDENSKDLFF
jgi:hypothetical protein